MKIKDIFTIYGEDHKFTEVYLYNNQGTFPVYSATLDKPYGFCNSFQHDKKMILVVNYGNAGKTRIVEGQFNIGRNVTGLALKDEYSNDYSLEYLDIIIEQILLQIGDKGNMGSLSQSTIKEVEISHIFPTKEQQLYYVSLYKKYVNLSTTLQKLLDCTNADFEYELLFDNFVEYKMKDITLLNKGSNKISEENIYKNFEQDGVPIYSSATENNGLMGTVNKQYYESIDKKGSKGELTWTTNGYAGKVFYRDTDYLYSEKCGRIVIRKEFKNLINLKFLMYQLNTITWKYKTAESNNGKLDIIHMSEIPIKLPTINNKISVELQNKIANTYEQLEYTKAKFEKILNDIGTY